MAACAMLVLMLAASCGGLSTSTTQQPISSTGSTAAVGGGLSASTTLQPVSDAGGTAAVDGGLSASMTLQPASGACSTSSSDSCSISPGTYTETITIVTQSAPPASGPGVSCWDLVPQTLVFGTTPDLSAVSIASSLFGDAGSCVQSQSECSFSANCSDVDNGTGTTLAENVTFGADCASGTMTMDITIPAQSSPVTQHCTYAVSLTKN